MQKMNCQLYVQNFWDGIIVPFTSKFLFWLNVFCGDSFGQEFVNVPHLNQTHCRHDVAEFVVGADAFKTGGQAGIMHPHAKMFV